MIMITTIIIYYHYYYYSTAPRIPPRSPWWERLWRLVGISLCTLWAWHRLHVGCLMASWRVRELHKLLLEDLGGSSRLSELAKSRFIGPVGVWEAHKSRSVVPVGVWRPPGMLRSHDLSCLSVFGGLPGSYGTLRRTNDWPSRWGVGARHSKIFRSLECLEGSLSDTPCSLRAAYYYYY